MKNRDKELAAQPRKWIPKKGMASYQTRRQSISKHMTYKTEGIAIKEYDSLTTRALGKARIISIISRDSFFRYKCRYFFQDIEPNIQEGF